MSGEAGLNTLLSLEVGSDNFLTLARDIQHHPFKNVVTHVDFLIVRRDEVISAEIPINLVGEAIEVQHGDGIVDQQLFTLHIKAKPADIPPSVDIDISGLTIGAALHVSDITIPPRRRAGDRPRGHGGRRSASPRADHRRGRGRDRGRRGGRRPATRPRRNRRATPSPPRGKPCSANDGPRRSPRRGTPVDSSWSGWATREASSPAPATTAEPRWRRCWPNGTGAASRRRRGCTRGRARYASAATGCWWPCRRPT